MTESSLLVPLKESGDKPPLFIVPSAGSTPLSLVKLARSLSPLRPVYSFIFAGMDEGQTAHGSIDEMASAYVAEIRAVQSSGPYYVAGHCFGGPVALEIVTRLRAQGDNVAALILLESFSPRGTEETEDLSIRANEDAASIVASETKKLLEIVAENVIPQLSRLPPKHAERYGSIIQQHIAMGLGYRAPRVDAPIALLRTLTYHEAVFGNWKHLTTQSFSEQIVPGGPYSMLGPPHVDAVGAALDEAASSR